MLRRIATVLALSTLFVAGSLVIASPAQAAVRSFTVAGSAGGNMTVFPEICRGCPGSANTTLVRWWQWIIYSELLPVFKKSGTSCASWVDGQFGPNTEKYTKQFQRQEGLVDDGRVGPLTWSAAEQYLVAGNIDTWRGRAWAYMAPWQASFNFYINNTTWTFNTCTWAFWY